MASLQDWNHFLRPNIWIVVIAIYFLALFISKAAFSLVWIVGIISYILICSASITLNHYYDYESDKKSNQLYRFPVANGAISRKFAANFSALIMILSATLAYLSFPLVTFLLVLFANFMIVTYSAPPIRIKERPYFETFWNGLGYGTLPYYIALTLFASIETIPLTVQLLGLVPFLISASGHILLQVRDIESDKKGKVKTTSVILGLKKMVKLSKYMVVAAGLIIIYLAAIRFLNPLAWLSIIAGAFIFYEHRKMKKDVTRSYRRLQIAYIIGGVAFVLSAA